MDRDRLEYDFARASEVIRKGVSGKTASGAEAVSGQTYAALVRAGFRPKLRGKYT